MQDLTLEQIWAKEKDFYREKITSTDENIIGGMDRLFKEISNDPTILNSD
jgi:hypothetical protein